MEPSRPSDDSALDRLLAEAAWDDPQSDDVVRLRRHWLTLRRARRRQIALNGIGATAVLLIAVGVYLWRSVDDPRARMAAVRPIEATRPTPAAKPAVVASNPRPNAKPSDPAPTTANVLVEVPRESPLAISTAAREPNLYEQLMTIDHPRGKRVARSKKPRPDRDRSRDQLIDQWIAAQAGPQDFILPVLTVEETKRLEPIIAARVRQSTGTNQLAAARLLARVATGNSLPLLRELSANPTMHAAAIEGLCRAAEPVELAALAMGESGSDSRKQLLVALAGRDNELSVGLFLDIVSQPNFRDDAFAALESVQHPPTTLLMAYLGAPRHATRQAAALALGHVSEPDLAERLAATLTDGNRRQEALLALLLNHSPQAATLVGQARQNLYLVASVRAAEFERDALLELSSPEASGSQIP